MAKIGPRQIGLVLLAAGSSQRFGPDNKLFATYKAAPLLAHSLKLIKKLASPACIVTGHEAASVSALCDTYDLSTTHNPDFATGMGGSIASGVRALPDTLDGYAIFLGDMPDMTLANWQELESEFHRQDRKKIVRPQFQGIAGHPVIFPRRYRQALCELKGQQGADSMIQNATYVDMNSSTCLRDVDRPEDLIN